MRILVKYTRSSNQRRTAGNEGQKCCLNVSGIDLDDQIIAESGLNGRSHTGFADQHIAFFV